MNFLQRSSRLFKLSLAVTLKDRELMWHAVFSIFASAVVVGIALLIGFGINEDSTGLWITLGVIASLIIGIISHYFKAAQMAGAKERLEGGDPTIPSSLAVATRNFAYITGWAILATSVQLALAGIRAVARDRGGAAGLAVVIATRIVGFAWEVITFLALPVVIVEQVGPFRALKRSKDLLKNTWGENLSAQIGGWVVALILMAPGFAVGFLVGFLIHWGGFIFTGIWVLLVVILLSMVSAVYQMALYIYATTGKQPDSFEGLDFGEVFRERKSRRQRRLGHGQGF